MLLPTVMVLHATTTAAITTAHTGEHDDQGTGHQGTDHDDNETSDDSGTTHVEDMNENETGIDD